MATAVVGVDLGGTFTDLVAYVDGRLSTWKLPSTPPDYGRALVEGLSALGVLGAAVSHGSTVATNALLERRGARCGLLTTAGFRDVLAIGRQARPALYDLAQTRPEPLVARELRREVPERVAADGTVLIPLDEAAARAQLDALEAAGVEAVAIGFLFSFVRPEHEQAVAAMARERGLYVSASHELLPEFREFERLAATVINCYVGPLMRRYLADLEPRLAGGALRVMQSNGGAIDASTAADEAVRTVLSGPAAGVVGAWETARAAGYERVVTFDMGGTSTDVAVCDGRLPLTRETVLAGLPIGVPTLDIHTVGAGGGSLARRDPGGALTVGPESAGAAPGPACYGRGGEVATVTDAHLVLGHLAVDRFLGGRMALHPDRADEAVARLAAELGLSLEACAEGILRVADTAMERALRVMSVERGLDPRRFVLLSFGGAGGLHAASLANRLQLPEVLIPPHAGALSALGLVLADLVRDASVTVMRPLAEVEPAWLAERFAALARAEQTHLAGHGCREVRVERSLDLRYRGQSFELSRPCEDLSPAAIGADFHAAHRQRYGYAREEAPVELVTARVRVIGALERPTLSPRDTATAPVDTARVGRQRCLMVGTSDADVYDLERLAPGHRLGGPAILAGEDTTVLVPAGWEAEVDRFGNTRLRSEYAPGITHALVQEVHDQEDASNQDDGDGQHGKTPA